MRLVTLAPSATEIAFALGLGSSVVGVSHDSDWPPEAVGLRLVTRPLMWGTDREGGTRGSLPSVPGTSGRAGRLATGQDAGLERRVALDEPALIDLRPDLVIAPRLDEVAVSAGELREVVGRLGGGAELLALDPASLEGILHSISNVGAMTGAESAALRLVERLRARLGRLERRVQRRREGGRRPTRVVALEGFDPPVAAGRWVPEQIRRAGGWELLGREGQAAVPTTWGAVRDVDPETLVLMPRGRHLDGTVEAWTQATRPPGWDHLEAVRRGQVFAVDAESYFTRPGPRFVEGIALLAEVLDPDGFVETSPLASWTPVD